MPVLRSRGPRLHGLPGARSSHCELRAFGITTTPPRRTRWGPGSRPFAPTLPTVQTARPPRKDSEDKGTAEIIVAKQRNGPIDEVKLAFLRGFTRFADLSDGE